MLNLPQCSSLVTEYDARLVKQVRAEQCNSQNHATKWQFINIG